MGQQGAEDLQLGRIAAGHERKFPRVILVTAFIGVEVRIGQQSEEDVGLWKTSSR